MTNERMIRLIADIEAWCAKHDVAETKFGTDAMGDTALLIRLREGRRVWPETENKIRSFMRNHKPKKRDRKPRPRPQHEAAA